MKICSGCGSLVSDSDLICGVCGRELSQATSVNEDSGATAEQRERPRWHANVPGLFGLSTGIALVGVGVYLFTTAATYASALLSFLPIGLGIVTIAITRDFVEDRRYRVLGSGRLKPIAPGSRYVRDEKAVEDEEDRKRASGEED